MHKNSTPDAMRGLNRLCADYVCRVDYMRPRAYRLYLKVPGAYRLYKWCEVHQHPKGDRNAQ